MPLHQFLSRLVFALAASGLAWPGFAASTLNAEVVGPAGEAIEDAAVFLVPVSAPKPARHAPLSAAVAQHDREFVPYLTVVQTGAAVSFPNQDPIRHHVYSFSKPKKFEIKLYAGDAPDPIIFDTPGVVTMGIGALMVQIGVARHRVESKYRFRKPSPVPTEQPEGGETR